MASSLPDNFHLLAFPVYWGLAILPHAYAIHLASGGNPLRWDNRNPRSGNLKSSLKSRLSPDTYAQYERAEASSANTFENMPLFYGAVLAAKVAGIDKGTLDSFALNFLLLRVAHSISYIFVKNQNLTWFRSAFYFWSSGLAVNLLLKAAKIAR